MADLNKLSKQALAAAMRGGTDAWGQIGSSTENVRYSEPVPPRSRRRCHCGCKSRATHMGMANGVALVTACEIGIRRWIRTGLVRVARQQEAS